MPAAIERANAVKLLAQQAVRDEEQEVRARLFCVHAAARLLLVQDFYAIVVVYVCFVVGTGCTLNLKP